MLHEAYILLGEVYSYNTSKKCASLMVVDTSSWFRALFLGYYFSSLIISVPFLSHLFLYISHFSFASQLFPNLFFINIFHLLINFLFIFQLLHVINKMGIFKMAGAESSF